MTDSSRRRERRRAQREAARRAPTRSSQAGWRSPLVLLTGGALLAGIALVLVLAFGQSGSSATPSAPVTSENPFGLVTPAHPTPTDLAQDATIGSATAPVTLELYEDYQCPVCGSFIENQLWRLVTDFVRPGLVRVVVHDVAILDTSGSDESVAAATAARCADNQNRFWPFHDWIYANQAGENKGGFRPDRLAGIAAAAGLDPAAYQSCVSAGTERATVVSTTQAALAQGFSETPTLVINGQKFPGLPDYDKLSAYLRSLLPSSTPSGPTSPAPSASQ